ncbi:RelA/SpoT domain-containing protein [Sphingomonas sp. RB3P16]|uniref:RelA/SpoT domain-containing protein n=1 Tax=Parasphingomonas frigoris TaxID=3096163 RepID=UPI002FC9ED8B
MGNWAPPTTSRKQVSKAGIRISQNKETPEDVAALEKWRAAHAYVINTFQANLRRRSRGTEVIVGTRLKRRATILNKLKRFPDMQLGRMHDIAGCRVIFPILEDLIEFRRDFHSARFAHKRKHIEDDRWNYLIHPKEDGYRGVHDVYEYNVRSDSGLAFNGLLVEIQYRTLLQHSWATAVEVAGLLTHNNPKFGQGSPDVIEFFAIASEILARVYEYSTSCYPDKSLGDLIKKTRRIGERYTSFRVISSRELKNGVDRF